MNIVLLFQILAGSFFVLMIACLEIGFRLGFRKLVKQEEEDGADRGTGGIEAAVYGLFGLLLAFTFAGGMGRLEYRRGIIVQEANAIGTAYLRIDLLPAADQPELRDLFRTYLDTRIETFRQETLEDLLAGIDRAARIQNEIWAKSVASINSDPTRLPIRGLLIPALNEMIDITTTRKVAMFTHLPDLILTLLVCVALISGLMAGHGMAKRRKGKRSVFHMVMYAAVVSLTMYAALDLEYPRAGLVTLESSDRALVELRDSMR